MPGRPKQPNQHQPNQQESKRKPIPRPLVPAPASVPEVVDPRWLLKALGAVLVLGLACAYGAVCALFYNQQWQFVLHPSRTVAKTPAAVNLPFEEIRFSVDAAGRPQLTGWWIPGDMPNDPTVLLLHGGDGSMGDTLRAVKLLHEARLNVLTFDPRGYGKSGGAHPTERSMYADAEAALGYLTQSRKIPLSSIIVFGDQLGASLAVELCAHQPAIPALILESADGDTQSRVMRDQRSKIVPVFLLFHEKFPLADPLHTLHTPKLLLSYTTGEAPVDARRAADPKVTAELPPGAPGDEVTGVIRRFLDTYVPQPPTTLQP